MKKEGDLSVPKGSNATGVLLVFHGARDAEGMGEFFAFLAEVRRAWHPLRVEAAFLEFVEPPILDAVAGMVEEGIREILVLPLFLIPATHLKTDVPAAIHYLRARYPDVIFRYGRHLGVSSLLLAILDERFQETEQVGGRLSRDRTGVLLVGRGSRDPDANSEVSKAARLFWEGRGLATVEVAFAGLTAPTVEDGLTRCVRLGCETIVVLPYFLFTGILVKRIHRQAVAFATTMGSLDIRCGRHLGVHPNLVEALTQRFQELHEGPVAMSCDNCKHRVSLVGFEEEVGMPVTTDHHHGLRSKASEALHGDGSESERHHEHGARTRFHH